MLAIKTNSTSADSVIILVYCSNWLCLFFTRYKHCPMSGKLFSFVLNALLLIFVFFVFLIAGLPPGSRPRMADEIGKGTGVLSPGDLNSNNNGETTASYAASYVSNTSSQNDADFIQDNSEYQWFLDYGYVISLIGF